MGKNGFPISRRTLLRGAGAAFALPWLEAMSPNGGYASQPEKKAPKRMAVLFMPNGVHREMWRPEGEGRGFELSKTLQPLCDLQDDILVLTNLWNPASDTGDGHYVKTAGLLTCSTIHKTVGVDLNANGVSLDQLALQKSGIQTPIPSLELGTEPVRTGVDAAVGYTRVYGGHIAWRTPTSPLAKEVNPRLVYDRLFRAHKQDSNAALQDKPLLDLVLEDASRLRKKLGSADQHRMDEYLHSIRTLEERIERTSKPENNTWEPHAEWNPAAEPPEEMPDAHQEHCRLMIDLMVLAFQTDVTRVSTFMFGNSVSNINFSFVDGVNGAHHSISHHEKKEEMLVQYERISRWHIEQYAYMLRRLKEIKEGEDSILDNSMVLFGSDLGDGNSHSPHNLPLVLAGKCGGRIDTGKHLVYDEDTRLSNLYVSMLDAFDVPVERFADSEGPLKGVLV